MLLLRRRCNVTLLRSETRVSHQKIPGFQILLQNPGFGFGETRGGHTTDDHLKAILLVGCCTSKPNVDDIMREKRQFL